MNPIHRAKHEQEAIREEFSLQLILHPPNIVFRLPPGLAHLIPW